MEPTYHLPLLGGRFTTFAIVTGARPWRVPPGGPEGSGRVREGREGSLRKGPKMVYSVPVIHCWENGLFWVYAYFVFQRFTGRETVCGRS
jgi:hypothetical protein